MLFFKTTGSSSFYWLVHWSFLRQLRCRGAATWPGLLSLKNLYFSGLQKVFVGPLNEKVWFYGRSIRSHANLAVLDTPETNNQRGNDSSLSTIPGLKRLQDFKAEIDQDVLDFEQLRRSYLRLSCPKEGAIPIALAGKLFQLNYAIDDSQDGLVLIRTRDICKAVAFNKRTWVAQRKVFKTWNVRLDDSHRKKAFIVREQNAEPGPSNAWLTKYGAEILLSYYASTKPEIVKLIRNTLITSALLSPFAPLAISTKVQDETLDFIRAHLKRVWPNLHFFKQKLFQITSGRAVKRCPDLYCEQLNLVVECDEYHHTYYAASYVEERKEDLKIALGDDVEFYHYFPQSKGFCVRCEAAAIVQFILKTYATGSKAHLIAMHCAILEDATLTKSADESHATSSRDQSQMTISIVQLQSFAHHVRIKQAKFEELRIRYLRAQHGSAKSIAVLFQGATFSLPYRIDKSIDDLLAVDRKAVCTLLCPTDDASFYSEIFKRWQNRQLKTDRRLYYAPATQTTRRRNKPEPETEWLKQYGLEHLLAYYRKSKPEIVNRIHQAFVADLALSPYRELPIGADVKVDTIRRILELVSKQRPQYVFEKRDFITPTGKSPRRKLDAYCDELKLNVQCRMSRYGRLIFQENYYEQRIADLRRLVDKHIEVYYLNPFADNFSVEKEAEAIIKRVDAIVERRK